MKNTVYYLGAGASIQAIPTIDGLRDRIKDLSQFIESYITTDVYSPLLQKLDSRIREHQNTLRVIKDDLEFLYTESEIHQTVDTLARKFSLKGDYDSLKRLKRGLVSYFFFEQCVGFEGKSTKYQLLIDKRYDNLIASIADNDVNGIKLRDDIKIITWNYDLQVEHTIQNYTNEKINVIKNKYQIHPNQISLNEAKNKIIDPNRFSMFKLNGNAFMDRVFQNEGSNGVTPHDININPNTQRSDSAKIGDYLVEFEELFPEGKLTGADVFKYFNFAWEKDEKYPGFDNMITNILDVIKNTERLIIVGYSFPFFNAEIDREILSACKPKEIIIQDLYPETIKDRLLELIPDYGAVPDKIKPPIKFTLQLPGNYFPISAAV
jgi:hypothetical protein